MIRLIRIGDQICHGEDQFAFWDTVRDRFISVHGEQVFDSLRMFLDHSNDAVRHYEMDMDFQMQLRALIPRTMRWDELEHEIGTLVEWKDHTSGGETLLCCVKAVGHVLLKEGYANEYTVSNGAMTAGGILAPELLVPVD